MAKDVVFEGGREVRTFVGLAHGAGVLINKTEQDQRGSNYTTMGSLLLTAFTFEAYLNYLGVKKVEFWNEIESISVMKKYSALCKMFNIVPDNSRRPYQTLKALFEFRNSIAHGKLEILKETKEVSSQEDPYDHIPKTKWEKYCTLENAKRAEADVAKIITELHQSSGLGDHPFVDGISYSTATLKKPNK